MKFLRTVVLALRILARNPLRSFLMMLGVTVGIAALTAMASVGETTKQETMRGFKRMVGTYNVVNIQPGAARTRGMPSVTTVEPSRPSTRISKLDHDSAGDSSHFRSLRSSRVALLRELGSLRAVRAASQAELAAVTGVSTRDAATLWRFFDAAEDDPGEGAPSGD